MRLGMEQRLVSYHLQKSSELKNFVNGQLERGFFVNTKLPGAINSGNERLLKLEGRG